jgi:hypothetical protein
MIGRRFGKLVVLRPAGTDKLRHRMFVVACDCASAEITVRGSHLRDGHTQSCGCAISAGGRAGKIKHGEARNNGTTEYAIWRGILRRCLNPKAKDYEDYGGRGITVCASWRDSYEAFLADMGRRPSPQHSVDRFPNKNGNYEPGNCRWATASEQNGNRRTVKEMVRESASLVELLKIAAAIYGPTIDAETLEFEPSALLLLPDNERTFWADVLTAIKPKL